MPGRISCMVSASCVHPAALPARLPHVSLSYPRWASKNDYTHGGVMVTSAFSYEPWNTLLAEIVTPDGKADYRRLAERRERLEVFVGQLGMISPESHPALFPSD